MVEEPPVGEAAAAGGERTDLRVEAVDVVRCRGIRCRRAVEQPRAQEEGGRRAGQDRIGGPQGARDADRIRRVSAERGAQREAGRRAHELRLYDTESAARRGGRGGRRGLGRWRLPAAGRRRGEKGHQQEGSGSPCVHERGHDGS